MIFGKITSVVEPEIVVNNQIIEIVETFKFLGVNRQRRKLQKTLESQKNRLFSGVTEVERLGINKLDVPTKMKSLLYTSLVRSKLVYGLERIDIDKNACDKELTHLESNFIKKICGVNKYSKSTSLLYAMNITQFKLYLYKRKLHFILQLLNNKSTAELLSSGVHKTLTYMFDAIGIKK
jgi:hypothetical protein